MRNETVEQAVHGGQPILQILVSFPIACFTCALLTDTAYAASANVMWTDFSDWLLAAGVAGGGVAALAALATFAARRRTWPGRSMPGRSMPGGSMPGRSMLAAGLGGLLVLSIAVLNNLVHSRDAWTSVMPTGLALSFVTFVVMLATVWLAAGPRRRVVVTSYQGARS